VVRNPETLQALSHGPDEQSHLKGAALAIVIVMANESKGTEAFDEARLAERMMLAAAAHGVGAGIWWFKDGGAAAKRILGVPEERQVRTALSLGYPQEGAPPRRANPGRKPLSELVHEEHY
jgi:nitroreductase